MAKTVAGNRYEDSRNQRLLENQEKLKGLLNLSKEMSAIANPKKSQVKNRKTKPVLVDTEIRRSSRERKAVVSYYDGIDVDLPPTRKRAKRTLNSSWATYLGVPIEEVKFATDEEKNKAAKLANKIQNNLEAEGHPTFIKSMVRSHVYSCFWLGLTSDFCVNYLSNSPPKMILEDEDSKEYPADFKFKRTALSGGWRAFAIEHKLHDGDALVFQLVDPARFKVYIVRANASRCDHLDPEVDTDSEESSKKAIKSGKKGVPKSLTGSQKKKKPSEVDTDCEESPKKGKKRAKIDKKDGPNNLSSQKQKKPYEVSEVRRSSRNK